MISKWYNSHYLKSYDVLIFPENLNNADLPTIQQIPSVHRAVSSENIGVIYFKTWRCVILVIYYSTTLYNPTFTPYYTSELITFKSVKLALLHRQIYLSSQPALLCVLIRYNKHVVKNHTGMAKGSGFKNRIYR